MAAGWTRDQMNVLIDAFKDEPCLYNIRSKNYHNRRCRAEALYRVFCKVKCIRPQLNNPKECQTKFLNMRNMYNVENRKKKESMKNANGPDDIYRPGLWYFERLEFLGEHYVPRVKKSTLPFMEYSDSFQTDESTSHGSDAVEASNNSMMEFPEEHDVKDLGETCLIVEQLTPPQSSWSSAECATPRTTTSRKRKDSSDSYTSALQLIADRLQQNYEDDIDMFVKYLATEMREIKCREAKIACKQKILKVVFEALENQ